MEANTLTQGLRLMKAQIWIKSTDISSNETIASPVDESISTPIK